MPKLNALQETVLAMKLERQAKAREKTKNNKSFFTKDLEDRLIANHKAQDGTKEFKAVAKLFNPCGAGTWYLSELDPETNVGFGLCVIWEKEIGYVDLNELKKKVNFLGLPIERDKYFSANKYTLEECKSL